VVDLAREQQSDIPFARVRFDRAAIARHGMRIADVARALEVGSGVHVVSQVMEGQAVFDLVGRTDPSRVQTFEDLRELLVVTPGGARVPLRALASVQRDRGPNEIGRENVQRRLVVSCNVAGPRRGQRRGDIRPPSTRRWSSRRAIGRGLRRAVRERRGGGAYLGFWASAACWACWASCTRRSAHCATPCSSWSTCRSRSSAAPLGVFLQGGVLSVASLVGFITLFGIATRNGIMLVSHIRHLVHRGGRS
jgi:Cu/Ag efflux pump CusA